MLSAPSEQSCFQDDELLSPQKLQVGGERSKDEILDYLCHSWGVSSASPHLPKSPSAPDPPSLVHPEVFKLKPGFIDPGLKSMGSTGLRHRPNKDNTNSNKIAPLILKLPI